MPPRATSSPAPGSVRITRLASTLPLVSLVTATSNPYGAADRSARACSSVIPITELGTAWRSGPDDTTRLIGVSWRTCSRASGSVRMTSPSSNSSLDSTDWVPTRNPDAPSVRVAASTV